GPRRDLDDSTARGEGRVHRAERLGVVGRPVPRGAVGGVLDRGRDARRLELAERVRKRLDRARDDARPVEVLAEGREREYLAFDRDRARHTVSTSVIGSASAEAE